MLIATIKHGGEYFVEPVIETKNRKVLVRLQHSLQWVKPFDVTHVGEDPLRRIPTEQRSEIHFAGIAELCYPAQTIQRASAADERREQEEWEAECLTN